MTIDEELQLFDFHYFGSLWNELEERENEQNRPESKRDTIEVS
jgi:hypothetical protein